MKAVAPTTFARMSESLMSRKPLHKRLSRGFATCRSLPPIVGKNWRQKLPDGSPQGCEMPDVRPSSVKLSSDLWTDLKPNGSHQVGSLFGTKVFENPKSTNLVERVIRFVGNDDSMVLDYFAGSGTTGHAVINLNREDGGRRKFILVEMADYFDTVLLPR